MHNQSKKAGSANTRELISSISKAFWGVYLRSHELAGNTGSGGRSEQCHVSRDAHTRISAREAGEKAITTKKNREFLFFCRALHAGRNVLFCLCEEALQGPFESITIYNTRRNAHSRPIYKLYLTLHRSFDVESSAFCIQLRINIILVCVCHVPFIQVKNLWHFSRLISYSG